MSVVERPSQHQIEQWRKEIIDRRRESLDATAYAFDGLTFDSVLPDEPVVVEKDATS